MQHTERKELDRKEPYRPFRYGTYLREVTLANGHSRRMGVYIPDDIRPSTAGIFLLPPSGVSIEQFLEKSSWKELADTEETKERFVIFVLESSQKGWNTQEAYGDPDGDVAYILAACRSGNRRDLVCVHESKFYIVGYEAGGTLAEMAAIFDPAAYAGLVSVDAPAVAGEYLIKAKSAYADNLMGYQDTAHTHGIRKVDIPMPFWMISEEDRSDSAEARYFREACGTEEIYTLRDPETKVFVRKKETAYPLNQEKEAYRVWISQMERGSRDFGRRINRQIWKDFLYPVRRWMGDPGGDLRMTRDPVRDLGMEYHYEMVDGYRREWYLFVPKKVREAPEKDVPLVFACHGYSCNGETYMGNSGWHDIAEKYGFLCIFPTAIPHTVGVEREEAGVSADNIPLPAWNNLGEQTDRPYENNFFEYMLDQTSAVYAVDKSRIYVTGHSNGSMMTSWLGLTRPELFAAIAPCSGIIHMIGADSCLKEPEVYQRVKTDLPVWMFGGQKEEWLLDGCPEAGNRTDQTIHTWWEMNQMPDEPPRDYGTGTVVRGRWHDWNYEKNGMPMVRFSGVEYFPHATMPEMSWRIWEEFFSHFARIEGEIRYIP